MFRFMFIFHSSWKWLPGTFSTRHALSFSERVAKKLKLDK